MTFALGYAMLGEDFYTATIVGREIATVRTSIIRQFADYGCFLFGGGLLFVTVILAVGFYRGCLPG